MHASVYRNSSCSGFKEGGNEHARKYLHASEAMNLYRIKTHFEDKLNEVISGLHIPQCISKGSLCGLNNQLSTVIACKGDFPFPFQDLKCYLFRIEGEESRCRRLSFIVRTARSL